MWTKLSRAVQPIFSRGVQRSQNRVFLAPYRPPSYSRMCSLRAGLQSGKQPSRQVLPSNVVPKHYRSFLDPNLPKFTYSGHVEIDVAVKNATNEVSVNILDLEIRSATLNGESSSKSTKDDDAQSITWTFPSTLQPNTTATSRVEFDGTLNDEMAGFYRSVHKDSTGKQHIVATTQMESTDCRRAFPCFDEPALKATFDISIAADPHHTVLSNSDVKSTEKKGDKIVTHFNTTPKMSSYLVAFIVGELSYVESNKFRVPVRVYADPGCEEKCVYAADLAARTSDFFEKTFGIEYPMPKCDMVGVHSFSAGAMENWGLITYRLVDSFYVEGEHSAKIKSRVTEVIQHELAHQWFGNSVTMEWWDGLWSNEGFATWMSWYAANHFYPDWKVWESYVNDAYAGCMALDSLRNSHPVQVPISRADEVPEIFDLISYLKGSCIIRMVSQYMGEAEFIKGISSYLARHKYANTTTDDLWKASSDYSGKDIKAFLDVWVTKTGFPLVEAGEPTDNNSKVPVTQHRYSATDDVKPEDDEVEYPVWLGVRKSDGSIDAEQMSRTRTGVVEVGNAAEFYKLNANQNGLFRVKYPADALTRLAAEGRKGDKSKLSVEDRIGVVLDLQALSGHQISTTQSLEIAREWSRDPEPNVVSVSSSAMAQSKRRFFYESEESQAKFREFVIKTFEPFLQKHGLDFPANEDIRLSNAKIEAFDLLVSLDDPTYVQESSKSFDAHKFKVNPNLASGVYRAVARHGKPEQWDELLNWYLQGTNGASGIDALGALGYTKDTNRMHESLTKIQNSTIKEQDTHTALAGLTSSSPLAHKTTYEYVIKNWDALREVFPVLGTTMARVVKLAFGTCTKQAQLDEFTQSLEGRNLTGIERSVGQAKDTVVASMNAMKRDAGEIQKWLS